MTTQQSDAGSEAYAMVYFAYDGSVNGDWVSHYAVQCAAASPSKALHIVYVHDGQLRGADLETRLARIRSEGERLEVEVTTASVRSMRTVVQDLLHTVPSGPDDHLVCGARCRERHRAYLRGTVSEQLLASGHCPTLALRVTHPGLLGLPRRLLIPVAGHPRGFCSGLPFLRLLAPQVTHLHLLHVVHSSSLRLGSGAMDLRLPGRLYCARVEQEIAEQPELSGRSIDVQVVVSDDVAQEIIVAANKTKSQLIYLGAPNPDLRSRLYYANPLERVLRHATCDVGVYRGWEPCRSQARSTN